jgi:hypothetical protein
MMRIALVLFAAACQPVTNDDTGPPTTQPTTNPTPTPPPTTDACPPADETTASTAATEAPFVVCTVPAAGDQEVDPALTELVVYFSEPMLDQAWAWVQVDANYPQTTGDASYEDDHRTNVLPVVLEPDHDYDVWVNDPFGTYMDFQDEDRNAATPYEIAFHTAAQ